MEGRREVEEFGTIRKAFFCNASYGYHGQVMHSCVERLNTGACWVTSYGKHENMLNKCISLHAKDLEGVRT